MAATLTLKLSGFSGNFRLRLSSSLFQIFSVISAMSDESERFREIDSDEDYYGGRSSRSRSWSQRLS